MVSFFVVLISTFAIMLLAEFGDKTNLIALSLMTESKRPYFVALFSTIGIGLSTIISVLIGAFLGQNFPLAPIRYGSALIFIGLGIATLVEKDDETPDDEEGGSNDTEYEKQKNNSTVPFYKPIYLVALAEFGDKSQLFAISAAAATYPLAVFIGSIIGMGTIMFLTAIFGAILIQKVHPDLLEKLAAILFIVAGLWIGITTFLA